MKVLFMGTPDFAAESLRALLRAGVDVAAVVSQPDRPKGRGHKLQPTAVKVAAEEAGIPVYQPEKLRDGRFMSLLEEIVPDVIAVAAYGKILPPEILNYPKYGCINVHASLLPKYRGAAPIQWAIANGEKETGVTIMQMDKGVDTGDMLLVRRTEIGEYETAQELFERLAVMGGELLCEALENIETLVPVPQDNLAHTTAPMISAADAVIDWTKDSFDISNLICAMNPWPGARTLYRGEVLKIFSAQKTEGKGNPGEILSLDKGKGLKVACGSGCVYLCEVQFSGYRRMDVEDYARGHELNLTTVLG